MKKHKIGLAISVLFFGGIAYIQALLPVPYCVDECTSSKGKEPWGPYCKLRFVENYSWLSEYTSENAPYRDSLDKLKHISLGEDGAFMSIGGRVRARYEAYENQSFKMASDDTGYLLTRYLLHSDFVFSEKFRVFTELRSSNVYGRDLPGGKVNSLADEFDVLDLFVDILPINDGSESLMVRLGRWEHTYGKGRVIGCREWSQNRNPLEGGKVRYQTLNYWVDAFVANSMNTTKYDWAEANEDDLIYGAYGHFKSDNLYVDYRELYVLGQNRVVGGLEIDRLSFGGRVVGNFGSSGWKYDVEGAYQSGSGDVDVSAYFFAIEVMKSFADYAWKPTLKFAFDYASGDDDSSDSEIGTWEGVHPYGHFYFGFTDAVGRQNLVSPSVQLVTKPSKKLTLRGDIQMLWLAESGDALYGTKNSTQVIRRGFDGADSFIGTNIDLFFKYGINHHMSLLGGYSRLFAGDFIKETGDDTDIERVFAQLQFQF